MKLDTAVKIFELFASVAVLATLVILVLEVRENTVAVQRSTFNNASDNQILWRQTALNNEKLFDAYFQAVAKGQQLDEKETLRVHLYVEMAWLTYEQAYFSHQAGMLGNLEWGRFEKYICHDWAPPEAAWQRMRGSFSNDFVLFAEECRESYSAE